jgi:hypothetical protein
VHVVTLDLHLIVQITGAYLGGLVLTGLLAYDKYRRDSARKGGIHFEKYWDSKDRN